MMQIVQATQPTEIRLSESFMAPYRKKGDPFKSLLARSTYLTKYSRRPLDSADGKNETWTDTIRRVVEGNIALAPGVSLGEAELLFHLFWTGQALPPGRGLWTGGVTSIPPDARFNCWYATLYGVDDWCWTANQLMLGGGVGVGLSGIDQLPVVNPANAQLTIRCRENHPDVEEVKPRGGPVLNGQTPRYQCADSREGWVTALRKVLTSAFEAKDLIVDLSDVRPRGAIIRTFGGIACGPGPLAHLLRATWDLVRGAAGRKPNSIECLDITNHIGLCIKAGNVRRSALIVLGSVGDQEFRSAKKDWAAVTSHRHTSNNSICFQSWEEIDNFDWRGLVEDNILLGEPGILNLPLVWQTDPGAKGVNPCGEVALHDREACNLAEVFPAKFAPGTDANTVLRLVTRYCLRNRLSPLSDAKAEAVQRKNMRLGVGLGGICDFDWTPEQLASWYGVCRQTADEYADELGVKRPLAVTTIKPSGTISLLNGSSPGIHAPFAKFYIRRTRIAKNDPMAFAMMQAGVPFEEDTYDKTGHTWVFSFPMTSPSSPVTQQNQTLREQFERQANVQTWWADNAVSATLNFDPETEKQELADCLKEFVPRLKSTSLLPTSHGYKQPPYEAIDESTYDRLVATIDQESQLVHAGDIEVEECAGGSCPIR
jgi:ribonucleoside-diphosphate reductase alpha chain/ribonucleoside-triphosphate reductase